MQLLASNWGEVLDAPPNGDTVPGMFLITEHALATRLMLTPAQLRRLVRECDLPHVELPNGEVRFALADVDEWIREHRRPIAQHVPIEASR